MKKQDVRVGGTYQTKVGTRAVEVRIERENPKGGWDAVSVASGKPIRVKDAARLRPDKAGGGGADAPDGREPAATTAAADPDPEAPPARAAKGAKGAAKQGAKPESKAGRKARDMKAAAAAAAGETPRRTSCLDAAAAVLRGSGRPMRCRDIVAAMAEQGLWRSNAPTPHATLSSAVMREIARKGGTARFRKAGPGLFESNHEAASND